MRIELSLIVASLCMFPISASANPWVAADSNDTLMVFVDTGAITTRGDVKTITTLTGVRTPNGGRYFESSMRVTCNPFQTSEEITIERDEFYTRISMTQGPGRLVTATRGTIAERIAMVACTGRSDSANVQGKKVETTTNALNELRYFTSQTRR